MFNAFVIGMTIATFAFIIWAIIHSSGIPQDLGSFQPGGNPHKVEPKTEKPLNL
jgi:hypothetical protein